MDKYRFITIDRFGDVYCVRLKSPRLEEHDIHRLGDELIGLCDNDGCRKMALSLGPQSPDCLYSVFLAKLIAVRNALKRHEGQLVLCEVSPTAFSIFEACLLHREFLFAPDFATAARLMSPPEE